MRQALLFSTIIIFLTGCALKSPRLGPDALPWPGPTDLKAYGRFTLRYPGHRWRGRLLLMEDTKGHLYFEGPTPFGLTLFQGNLNGDRLCLVFFPGQSLYTCTLKLPPFLEQGLPYLLLGRLPLSWKPLIQGISVKGEAITAYFQAQGLEGRLTWRGKELRQVILWKGTTRLFVFRYQREKKGLAIDLKVPTKHLVLKLLFSSYTEGPLPTDFYRLRIPPGFKVFSCVVDPSF